MTTDPVVAVARDLRTTGRHAHRIARSRPRRSQAGSYATVVLKGRQIGSERFEGGRMSDAYEEMLRADRAELALADATRKLARVLEMADAWEQRWGDGGIRADVAAEAVRRAVRGLEFAP